MPLKYKILLSIKCTFNEKKKNEVLISVKMMKTTQEVSAKTEPKKICKDNRNRQIIFENHSERKYWGGKVTDRQNFRREDDIKRQRYVTSTSITEVQWAVMKVHYPPPSYDQLFLFLPPLLIKFTKTFTHLFLTLVY